MGMGFVIQGYLVPSPGREIITSSQLISDIVTKCHLSLLADSEIMRD